MVWRLINGKKSKTFQYDEAIISIYAKKNNCFAFKNHQL